MVVSVGVDVSKDKHDCFILSSEGEVLADVFTIPNNLDGFRFLLRRIRDCTHAQDKIKVGLEATGHYSYNLLGFLLDNGLPTYVLNPLRTNLYRKSLSLRKTKTDRVDARTIAAMLLSDAGLKPYTNTAYHNEELKSLTRYRFDKVKDRAKLKSSIARLVCILFPELEKLVPSLHIASVYSLLEEFPGAKQIAAAHLTRLKTLLETASKGHYKRICLLRYERPPETLLVLGCLPSLLNYSTPFVSSVNWIPRLLRLRNKSNPLWRNSIPHYHHSGPGLPYGRYDPGRGRRLHSLRFPGQAVSLRWDVALNLPVRAAQELLPAHGKAWLSIPTLRPLQRDQVCLPLGPDLCCLSC